MTLTPELQRLYASNPNGDTLQPTLEFWHPAFSKAWFLTAWPRRFYGDLGDSGSAQRPQQGGAWFEPAPFQVVLPTIEGGGHQQMRISISNVGRALLDELDAATAADPEPIICRYRAYVNEGGIPSPNPALELLIEATEEDTGQISAIAARSDIVNEAFPRQYYRLAAFPGLRR